MIDHPAAGQLPQLLPLWKSAFGEYGGFWELFRDTAFSRHRCRCLTEADQVAASLCWLDCTLDGRKIAYLYAVVTHPDFRGRGLCRKLLADTHTYLEKNGYDLALLVPATQPLRQMYARLGYETCTFVKEVACGAGETPISLRAIGTEEYARLRRKFLPPGGVLQEGENLNFLAHQAQFYAGDQVLLAAYAEGKTLTGMELLGDASQAPAIVTALNCTAGTFRCPGTEIPFAMAARLRPESPLPQYFGWAFD